MKLRLIFDDVNNIRKRLFGQSMLVENQVDYLARKYADVDPALIQQAIELDRKNAEKLVFGLQKGVITRIEPDSIAAVADLDPFAKASRKSESDLAFDEAVRAAKRISPKYWQWILKSQKLNPDAHFDEGIFHYLEAEGLTSQQIADLSLEEVSEASRVWHEQQFSDQESGGVYTLTPDKNAIVSVGAYAWVPVDQTDQRVEGEKMQNCIGRYCKVSDSTKIFSLRNKFNNPHVSFSIKKQGNQSWHISEIKGKQNKSPLAKYVPYVLKLCEYLFSKGVTIPAYGSDFWNLDSPDLYKYVKYHGDTVDTIPEKVISLLPDDELNGLVLSLGVSYNFPSNSRDESIISRLYADTIYKLLAAGRSNKLVKACIKSGVLDEQQLIDIINKFGSSRTIDMLVRARFRPEQFLEELKKIHPEDLIAAFDNYKDAVEAFEGYNEYFGHLLGQTMRKLETVDQWGHTVEQTGTLLLELITKTPSDQLIAAFKMLADDDPSDLVGRERTLATERSAQGKSFSRTVIFSELLRRAIKSSDSENIINLVKLAPVDYPESKLSGFFERSVQKNSIKPIDVILAVDYDDLPRLFEAGKHNSKFKNTVGLFMSTLDEPLDIAPLSGTTMDVSKTAEAIMNTDDVRELDNIRRVTKSRGMKVLANRKIARLNRMDRND